MVNFFIGRPIFATVLALLMLLVGGICIFILPVSLYPEIVPPQVQVTTTYTGADAQTVANTVTTPIEQKVNGVKGMIYMSSNSTSNGLTKIVATFDVGYPLDIAAVDVQNKLETAKATLPDEVQQFGIEIKSTSTSMVCVVNLVSPKRTYDSAFLSFQLRRNQRDRRSPKRIKGVGDVNTFGRKYAMRVWLDSDRMANQTISVKEVIDAIKQENRQAASGKVGAPPAPVGQVFEYPITAKGRLETAAEFDERSLSGRSRTEPLSAYTRWLALSSARKTTRRRGILNGVPAATMPIYQLGDSNALDIVTQTRKEMDRLAKNFPPDLEYRIAYDTTQYVAENISEVQHTLFEAFGLVLIVVFVFLQGFRATLIPLIAIPVSLVATFALMAGFGFSINTLTLCGLVLAIGLVVDDAIIVVENVEKQMEHGLGPLEATRKAMSQIAKPIVTITLVLRGGWFLCRSRSYFRTHHRTVVRNQFALTIVFSFILSAINSLTFSPAMSRLFLRPKHGETKFFFFRWFNSGIRWIEDSYDSILEFTAKHWWTIVVPSVGLLVLTFSMVAARPKGFIPVEDQWIPDHHRCKRRTAPRKDRRTR